MKVVRDPFAFTFSDELVHQHNVDELLRSGTLFGTNSILPITPAYPGLSSATGALSSLTGLSSFTSGLIVIGAARLLATLALFLLVEAVLRSDRAAAVAALAYVGMPNYMFFSAQFAYESLALPLALFVLMCVALRAKAEHRDDRWLLLGCAVVPAVVVTHHLTSYALLASLSLMCLLVPVARLLSRRGWSVEGGTPPKPPLAMTLWTALLIAGWLVYAGQRTSGYLSVVITRAISQTWSILSQEAPPRALFQADGTGSTPGAVAPGWERVVGIGSVVVLAGWVVLGLVLVWRSKRSSPLLLVLSIAAVAYLATFPLRFVPAAWESAARASEFLFVGVATIAAVTCASWRPRPRPRPLLVAAAILLLAAGGVIAGWPTDRRVASPLEVEASGATIDSEVFALGRWSGDGLPSDASVATEPSDARVLQLYGDVRALAGTNPDIEDILHLSTIDPWMVELLRAQGVRYVAVDRRVVASDNMDGYFFPPPSGEPERAADVVTKFERAGAWPIFESGAITVFDITPLLDRPSDGRPSP